MKSIQANGIQFSYLEEGTGPLVLCVHGYPDTAHTWTDLMGRLASAGYRAIAPNTRGIPPTSTPLDGDYSVLALGSDLVALIDTLSQDGTAFVVAHDWGAYATYAAANLAPERIRRMVTLSIPHTRGIRPTPQLLWAIRHFFYYSLPWVPERSVRANNFAGVDAMIRRWSPRWEVNADDVRHVKEAYANGGLSPALGYYRAFVRGALGARGRAGTEVLRRKTAVPTLFLVGEDEPGGTELAAGSVDAFSAPYSWRVIEGAGHFVHRERPEVVAEAVLDWFADRGEAPGG